VANGIVYLQDLGDNVYVLALTTGKLQWEYKASATPTRLALSSPNFFITP
jgi:outer membrane protein assembly factor BamB